ncbi:MAG: 4'-phosphopantetheinyl transferase superfamily protein [Erysipelotrichaceae bacterium]|nr:4'-phosphopantetheinyl transferase superfamily protein [Erysipelotrichaceae bacterium]
MEYIIKNINDFNKDDINNFYDKIPKLKKDKIYKFKNYESKVRSIVGEIILKELLVKKNISYNSLDYYINEYGKPYLKDNTTFFNISHSFDYVITAISDNEVGIDIEKIRKTPIKIINQFATEKEKEYILSSNNNIEERIFKIYTLKEAYFKMLGTNLNNILEVEFIIKNDKIYCNDENIKVEFINDIKGYIIAYCEKL